VFKTPIVSTIFKVPFFQEWLESFIRINIQEKKEVYEFVQTRFNYKLFVMFFYNCKSTAS